MQKDVRKWLKQNNKTPKQLKNTVIELVSLRHPVLISMNKLGITYKHLSLNLVMQLWEAVEVYREYRARELEISVFDEYMLNARGI